MVFFNLSSFRQRQQDILNIFQIFLRLGLTSFGGPVAHLAYFRTTFVDRLGWLSPGRYAELVALCQFLPGPASSQVGMAIGLQRAGYMGAMAAWLGFTLPSALLMILGAQLLQLHAQWVPPSLLHGLKLMTVAVVAQALWSMGVALCRTPAQRLLMLLAAIAAFAIPTVTGQLLAMAVAALCGRCCVEHNKGSDADSEAPMPRRPPLPGPALWPLMLYLMLLLGLPLLNQLTVSRAVAMVDAFYRTGALVFGGGHVVLPLLQAELVAPGWIDPDTFLAGYSLAQAMPGPLFTFAGFAGASIPGSGWPLGMLSILAIFAPSFFLVAGVLPLWDRLRSAPGLKSMLAGINAAVVGLLLATFIHPVCSTTLSNGMDTLLAILAFIALQWLKLPAWAVVIGGGLIGWLLDWLPALN